MSDREKRAGAANGSWMLTDWLALKDRALDVAAEGITIAAARLPDRPLIYANNGFERMTGYSVAEVLGRNCRFLQGEETDESARAAIREALESSRECVVELRNFRKDGTPFWNRLSISPVRDDSGEVTHFIGIQSDVTARREAEEALRQSNAALEHDMKMAARVQQSLLPPPEVELAGFRIAHAFLPCDDLAGDGVGVVPLPDGRLALYLLDVSGHGVGAALLSFTLNHVLTPTAAGALVTDRADGEPGVVPPARLAARLNRQFPMERSRQYFTMVYGVLAPGSGRLDFVVAGHPPPVLLRRGAPAETLPGASLPVGMLGEAAFVEQSLDLAPGDRLLCYTDGVVEATNGDGEELGLERLLAALERERERPLRAGLDAVADEVRAWCGGPLADDLTLLAVERMS